MTTQFDHNDRSNYEKWVNICTKNSPKGTAISWTSIGEHLAATKQDTQTTRKHENWDDILMNQNLPAHRTYNNWKRKSRRALNTLAP